MAKIFSVIGLLFLLTSLCSPARAQDNASPEKAASERERLQRLSTLCKIWGTIRFQHPFLAYKDIDWDAALVTALPKVEAAKNPEEFAAAVQIMLDALQDPSTRVIRRQPPMRPPLQPPTAENRPSDKWITPLADGIVAVDMAAAPKRQPDGGIPQYADLRVAIGKARGVVFDCRRSPFVDPAAASDVEHPVFWLAVPRETKLIGSRHVVHSGYRSQVGSSHGLYSSGFEAEFGERYVPLPNHRAPKSVFIVGENSGVPDVALALQHAGDAFIVVRGKASEDGVVPQRLLSLGAGFYVLMRTAEPMTPEGGAFTFRADAEATADSDVSVDGPAHKAALALLKDPKVSRRGEPDRRTLPAGLARTDKSYADTPFPDREHRLLALFRYWNVIHFFYPYKHLLDRDWDAVLPEFLPKFVAARDEVEYGLTVREMATRTQDSHSFVVGAPTGKFFGVAPAAIGVRWIEEAVVADRIWDEKAVRAAGVRIGDVVLKVDGEPVDERIKRYGKYKPASTPQAHKRDVLNVLLDGEEGSTCKLTLRGADGKEREAALPRSTAYDKIRLPPSRHEVFEILPGNLGYVDLTRLEVARIDPMLETLKATKGIIFDMRGYPRGVFGYLAPRLNVKNARHAAAFRWCVVRGKLEGEDESAFMQQAIAPTNQWKYQGKTAMLIDENAQSQSEHTGLFLEAASGVTFIGSPTAGANGNITYLVLPGGIRVAFSGHDVRHADGRQLQRIGLVPHIEVKPTIQGIREGKDEVLERALKFLSEGK